MQLSALTASLGRFLAELQRRKVLRLAAAYAVGAWIVLQVAVALQTAMSLSASFSAAILALLVIGFFVVAVLAWFYEITPEGVKRTAPATGDAPLVKPQTTDLILAGALTLVVIVALVQLLTPSPTAPPATAPATTAEATPAKPEPPALGDKSIAVLPFANLSPDKENEYFADGLTEELLNLLTKIGDLKVISRTSSFAFKGKNTSLPEIAKQLGVRHILEGSVRVAGDSLRVTAQLIDVSTDTHVWSNTYERKVEEIFAVQDEIARTIAEALKIEVTLASRAKDPPTRNLRAYRLYLEGLDLYRNRAGPTGPQVIDRFKAAVQLDDKFAEAHAALAISYYSTVGGSVLNAIAKPKVDLARAEALRAIELKRNLALPYSVLGSLDRKSFAWESAMQNAEKAVAADANDTLSRYYLGILQGTLGYISKASDTFAEVQRHDPLFDRVVMYTAVTELAQGNDQSAAALAERMTKSSTYPISTVGHILLAAVARNQGDAASAVRHMKAMLPAKLKDRPFVTAVERAIRAPETRPRAVQALKDEAAKNPSLDLFPALVFVRAMDEVFEILFAELDAGETWRFDSYRQVSVWGDQQFLTDPRFKDVVKRMGLVDYWKKHGWPDRCRPKGEDDFECS